VLNSGCPSNICFTNSSHGTIMGFQNKIPAVSNQLADFACERKKVRAKREFNADSNNVNGL